MFVELYFILIHGLKLESFPMLHYVARHINKCLRTRMRGSATFNYVAYIVITRFSWGVFEVNRCYSCPKIFRQCIYILYLGYGIKTYCNIPHKQCNVSFA